MFEDQMDKVVNGLMLIVPAILLLRWILTRTAGTPEDMVKHRVAELERRYAQGGMDQETYEKHLERLHQE